MIYAIYFISDIIMICIRCTNWISLYSLPCLFSLRKLLGVSETYLIVDTYKHGWTIVWVAMMTLYLFLSCCQYQSVLVFIILIYSAFIVSSPTLMTFLSTVFFLLMYMKLIRIWQHNIPLWFDLQYLSRHIFHYKQVQTCCHWCHLIKIYAMHKSPRLFIGKLDNIPVVKGY